MVWLQSRSLPCCRQPFIPLQVAATTILPERHMRSDFPSGAQAPLPSFSGEHEARAVSFPLSHLAPEAFDVHPFWPLQSSILIQCFPSHFMSPLVSTLHPKVPSSLHGSPTSSVSFVQLSLPSPMSMQPVA